MTHTLLYAVVAMVLFCIGFHALLARRNLIRRILAVNIMGSSVFMLFVAMAARVPEGPPDPLPHAMVLTGIVVAVSATALALSLTRHIHAQTGAARLPED